MRTAISWESPSTSQAHRSLRKAAIQSGFDDLALRHLLRLINAHPRLVAHARIFTNIAALLEEIAKGSVGPLGPWATYLNAWISMTEWASKQESYLSGLDGLHQFNKKPQHEKDHPLLGEGVDRHGVVASLWNRHESCQQYPPDPKNEPGWRYFRLQAHLLYSYFDARWRWVSLNDYESHKGAKERPIAPALTGPASRAIREFSLQRYDRFLEKINPSLPAPEFYRQIRDEDGNDDDLPAELQEKAESYLVILQRYFTRAWRVHNGRRPSAVHRIGSGGGLGSKDRIPGFISVEETQLVLERQRKKSTVAADDDEDSWPPINGLYLGYSDTEDEIDSIGMEKSGLSPSEDLEPVLQLVDADQYAKKMHGAYYGHFSREMAAQSYAWDWGKIAQGELHGLWVSLECSINAGYQNPSNKSNARYVQIAALMTKYMLLYGQSYESACSLRIKWVSTDHVLTTSDEGLIEHPTLFARGVKGNSAPSDQLIEFGLPALSPVYKTTQEEELENISRQLADGLVLPDLSNLGQQILKFYLSEGEQDGKVFHINLPTAEEKIKALLKPLDARITMARITRTMPTLLTQQTGDTSLAWVTFAMTECQNEPRLHYTMHSTDRIRQAYANASKALLRTVGHKPSAFKCQNKSTDPMHIGCRFVFAFSHLKELITNLKHRLTERFRNAYSLDYIMQYDRDYLFYTYLMLTVSTSTRAIRRPVSLFLEWQKSGQSRNGILSGLWDKETAFQNKSRLVKVLPPLAQQFRHYLLHIEFLMAQLRQTGPWKSSELEDQLLITFDDKYRPMPLTPTWIEERFNELLKTPVPCNFSRAFIRTELLERGLHAEIVDAFLGHANEGESPFSRLSTFDFDRYTDTLGKALTGILDELGLEPIESRLVPYPTRLGSP